MTKSSVPWRWLALAAVVLAVAGAGLYIWRSPDLRQAAGSSQADPSAVGGPFKLVDQTGATVEQGVLRGKWSAVFFGYTFCPDVCPTTLSNLGEATRDLPGGAGGDQAKRFQVVFITVDPARDTPAVLRAYLSSATFPKGVIGLTGSADQIAAAARAYHAYYQKVSQGSGSSYSMDHSAVVYLMDPQGRFLRPLDVTVAPHEIARQIDEAMAGGS